MEPTEQERAQRYHEAAVKDANRYIVIMAGLVDTTHESIKAESTDSGDEDSLTSEERAILIDDSFKSETSEQLFGRVRLETAKMFSSVNNFDDLA